MKGTRQRVDQVGQDTSQKDRRKFAQHAPDRFENRAEPGQYHIAHYADQDRDRIVIPFFVFKLISFHCLFALLSKNSRTGTNEVQLNYKYLH